MTNENITNGQIETKLYNLELITKSLRFVNNTAQNVQSKNDLVQETYFDFLSNKSKVKEEMILNGFLEPKNKDIAQSYFKSILTDLSQRAFKDFNIEIKEVIKEDKEFNYSFTNKDKTQNNENFIIAFKELFKLYKTLIQLISTNNLSLRIKLFNYKEIKAILDNLAKEIEQNGNKVTVKSLINGIDKNSNDLQYKESIKAILKSAKEVQTENIEPLLKSIQKLTLEAKKALLLKLQSEINSPKEDLNETLEDLQSPTSKTYSLED